VGGVARRWTPELTLRGTLAFAPASHVGEQARMIGAITTPGSMSALAAMMLRGIDVAHQHLGVTGLLSDRAQALFPQLGARCVDGLARSDSFGAIAPAELFRAGAPLDGVYAALDANDPETLTLRGPVLIEQGTADTNVFPALTEQLAAALERRDVDVAYRTYGGIDHFGAVTDRAIGDHASAWLHERLGKRSR
jgi:fermentation-respiration switch protein FrsA (DUF1100 family)